MSVNAPLQLTPEQVTWLKGLKMSKRAAVVRDHILEHGAITTDELAKLGYNHPPRAARDLKDAGAGVRSVMVNVGGKRMASYTFDGKANEDGAGRVVLPKAFTDRVKESTGFKCEVCQGKFAGRVLQADHRVPFAIAGDQPEMLLEDFMPLCAPDNRAKSWSCEHCPNWTIRDASACERCFWAHPDDYTHVELRAERRLNLVFQETEVQTYDDVRERASAEGKSVQQVAKEALAQD
ncbi:HNH endonuclease signature motif containing protein [Curtobacterium sp. MCSS17_007]|uniref:HNH endonuclease signature motif containing protein n=1 Tax=Curtobacterium sp. MCSS17_007 TaxID=2175646 RepID=UPI0011B4782C|nr:HNH endonuclease signature motif containing protein [Curtobacterium sp. MCSS17_007]WIE74497.1 HNH endonuclease signature motif containing protein [Curtobacterium sp. MCSS17_007]